MRSSHEKASLFSPPVAKGCYCGSAVVQFVKSSYEDGLW
jgi:hypothetical protein